MELKEYLTNKCITKAKNPIDQKLFHKIPHFEDAFGKDPELWKILAELAGGYGNAYIEHKKFKPDEKIILKGNYDQMLYWLVGGNANVLVEIGGKPVSIYTCKIGEFFGEAVITGEERRADVIAGKSGAEVIEIDFSISDICFELNARLNKLLTHNLCDKLKNSYLSGESLAAKFSKKLSDKNGIIQELQQQVDVQLTKIEQIKNLIGK